MKDSNKIIGWWSGGITSAVACMLAIKTHGKENCRIIFIDTFNEDEDTYRFKDDCSKWYGIEIESIYSLNFDSIQSCWRRYNALNNAKGAVCSADLKRVVREKWQKENTWEHQIFGFDPSEPRRATNMQRNHPKTKPIFPLLENNISKEDCLKIVAGAGIEVPRAYKWGFTNNNCLLTGCVQGGCGYWEKMRTFDINKFNAMALMEHELTDAKGKPVTMLKDQSKEGKAKGKGMNLVFLLPHPDYPEFKDLSMIKGRPVKPLMECNGFCGIDDLEDKNPTQLEINFEDIETESLNDLINRLG